MHATLMLGRWEDPGKSIAESLQSQAYMQNL